MQHCNNYCYYYIILCYYIIIVVVVSVGHTRYDNIIIILLTHILFIYTSEYIIITMSSIWVVFFLFTFSTGNRTRREVPIYVYIYIYYMAGARVSNTTHNTYNRLTHYVLVYTSSVCVRFQVVYPRTRGWFFTVQNALY